MRLLKKQSGFTAVEVLLVGAMLVLMLTLLMPCLLVSRRAAQQVECLNNLKQIGVALQNYEAVTGVLPPGCVNPVGPILNEPSGYHMSWTVQLLPMMDQQNLFEMIDRSLGAYSTATVLTVPTMLPSLVCPSDPAILESSGSGYAGSIGGSSREIDFDNTGLLFLNSSIADHRIPDGRSNTFLAGEIRGSPVLFEKGLGWLSGTAATLRSSGIPLNSTDDRLYEIVTAKAGGFGSWHDGNVSMLFADGAVKSMSAETDCEILVQLGDRADGEMLELQDDASDRRVRNILQRESSRMRRGSP